MTPRNLDDPDDTWWTIQQAADHLRVKPHTIRDYIRSGVTLYAGRFVRRDQLLAMYRERAARRTATRFRTSSGN